MRYVLKESPSGNIGGVAYGAHKTFAEVTPHRKPNWLLSRLMPSRCPEGRMTLDEKVRYATLALVGANIVFASPGLHIAPLEAVGGVGR